MARPNLRTVQADEQAKPKTPKNITEALEGSSRDVWVAMRKALARQLDAGEISSNSIASAYTKLQELDRLIRQADRDAAEAAQETQASDVDDHFDASAI